MYAARFYLPLAQQQLKCQLCAHGCVIAPGRRGRCGVRENRDGHLYSLTYGLLVAEQVDPIEKKPLYHFLPASRSYSIASPGCNFRCLHCQNHSISQSPLRGEIRGVQRSPAQVTAQAVASGCASISYTYTEPTLSVEFILDCCRLGRAQGLRNILVTNGYMGLEAASELAACVDAANIDIKAFSDLFYQKVCGARLQPVLDSVLRLHQLGVWIELTTLLIPGLNDDEQELQALACFIARLSPDIPWHLSAFHPAYRMPERPRTPLARLELARRIGHEQGLSFIYLGNVSSPQGSDTHCPVCGALLIERRGFFSSMPGIENGCCSACHRAIPGRWR